MDPSTQIQWLLMVAVVLAGAAIVLAYYSRVESVICAIAAMICGQLSGYVYLPWSPTLVCWIITAVIAAAITLMLPAPVRASRSGVAYFATGALAGALLGMTFGLSATVIIGSAIGLAAAAVAYGNMAGGKALGYPSKKYLNYLLAKGLPMVATFAMLGILFSRYQN